MKSLRINTLVVTLALALWGTSSMAATELSGQPLSQSEKDTRSITAETYAAPFYALNRLDAQSLAAQEMTDQELKAVEGGYYTSYTEQVTVFNIDLSFLGSVRITVQTSVELR